MPSKHTPTNHASPEAVQEVLDMLGACTGDSPTEQAIIVVSKGDEQHVVALNFSPEDAAMALQQAAAQLLIQLRRAHHVLPTAGMLQ